MTHFPVNSSILSTPPLEAFLQTKYKFSSQVKCSLLKAGINHTYLVTDQKEKFVFRIYTHNWRTQTEIKAELKLLNELKKNNIAVSYPVLDQKSNYIQTIKAPEGERFAVLFSFAEGEKLQTFSEEMHFKVGTIMASLHNVTNKKHLERVDYTPEVLLVDSLQEIKAFLPEDCEEMQWMKSTQKYLLTAFDKVDSTKIRHGIVHLDIWFDNLNITKEKEVTIFDFDFCGNGWLCLDIAYYILQLHSVEKDITVCQQKVDEFLNGYESITKISKEEREILPMLGVSLYFFYLGVQCQRFDDWSNVFLNETYLKRFIKVLVKRYFDLRCT